jgi:hypothetical protein
MFYKFIFLRLCTAFLTFICISYAMPFILCALICCCLPCIIFVMSVFYDRPPPSNSHGGAAGLLAGLRVRRCARLRQTSLLASCAWQAVRFVRVHSGEVAPAASTWAVDGRRPPSAARSHGVRWATALAVYSDWCCSPASSSKDGLFAGGSGGSGFEGRWRPPGICDLAISMKGPIFSLFLCFFYEQLCVAAAAQLDAWRHTVLKLNIARSTTPRDLIWGNHFCPRSYQIVSLF